MKTHWIIRYVVDGTHLQESTQSRGLEPLTEEELERSLVDALAEVKASPAGAFWIRDLTRGGQRSLVFLEKVQWVELERVLPEGVDPDEEPAEPDLPPPGTPGLDRLYLVPGLLDPDGV